VWAELREWIAETFGEARPLVWAAHNGDAFDLPVSPSARGDAKREQNARS
jgi:hypothetical protein